MTMSSASLTLPVLQRIDASATEIVSSALCERCWGNVGQACVSRVIFKSADEDGARTVISKAATVPKTIKGGAKKADEKLRSFFVEVLFLVWLYKQAAEKKFTPSCIRIRWQITMHC